MTRARLSNSKEPSWSRATSILMVLFASRVRKRLGLSSSPRRRVWSAGNCRSRILPRVLRRSWLVIPAAPTLKRCVQSASPLTAGRRSSDSILGGNSPFSAQPNASTLRTRMACLARDDPPGIWHARLAVALPNRRNFTHHRARRPGGRRRLF
jgi:hypothetical protein